MFTPKLNNKLPHNGSRQLERHVVLVAPQIHWNAGNIGRTCLATGAFLHLVRPLAEMMPRKSELAMFSKRGANPFWSMAKPNRLFLVFGSETRGLPDKILREFADFTYHIPITSEIRSLNLSTAAGIALYESLRNAKPFHDWPLIK